MWWRLGRKNNHEQTISSDVRNSEQQASRQIAELIASRRAIVDAYEVERRRIERDLHDGAQQYLVAAAIKLGEAQGLETANTDPQLVQLISGAQDAIREGLAALRKTVRGIHPQKLIDQGLADALEDIAETSPANISIICPYRLPELPEGVLAAGYFFAAEAINNATKYAPTAAISVLITVGEQLRISITDAGAGGARLVPGGGLAGMKERLAAFGGSLTISSPQGGPTQITGSIPLLLGRGQSAVQL